MKNSKNYSSIIFVKTLRLQNNFFLYLFFLFFLWLPDSYANTTEKQRLLVLHSYHQGYEWSDGIHAGIMNTLKETNNIEIYIEYLDLIRHADNKDYLEQFDNFYKAKFLKKGISFDGL